MASIDRLSAWILKHFAATLGEDELEAQIKVMDGLANNAKIGDDDNNRTGQSGMIRRDPWTYTASVTTRVMVTDNSAGWEPLLSLSMASSTVRLSRDGLTIETPASIMAAHEKRRTEQGLRLNEIMAGEEMPNLQVARIRRWEAQTTYEIEEPKIISWAYAKGRARKAIKIAA